MKGEVFEVGYPDCIGAATFGAEFCTCTAPIEVPSDGPGYPWTKMVPSGKRRCTRVVSKEMHDKWWERERKKHGVEVVDWNPPDS